MSNLIEVLEFNLLCDYYTTALSVYYLRCIFGCVIMLHTRTFLLNKYSSLS